MLLDSDRKGIQKETSVLAGTAVHRESQRFGPDYNSQLNEWREFWQEHELPEQKHVKASDFRTRLGHVFGLGAGKHCKLVTCQ